jgi:hypothetical protein
VPALLAASFIRLASRRRISASHRRILASLVRRHWTRMARG